MVAGVTGLMACDDAFGPWGSSGTYALSTVNGQALPAPVFQRVGNDAWSVSVIGGELRLRSDHTFRMDVEYLEQEPGAEVRYATALTGRWGRENDLVTLEYVDPGTGRWRAIAAVRRRGSLEFSLAAAGIGVGMRALFER